MNNEILTASEQSETSKKDAERKAAEKIMKELVEKVRVVFRVVVVIKTNNGMGKLCLIY